MLFSELLQKDSLLSAHHPHLPQTAKDEMNNHVQAAASSFAQKKRSEGYGHLALAHKTLRDAYDDKASRLAGRADAFDPHGEHSDLHYTLKGHYDHASDAQRFHHEKHETYAGALPEYD